MKKAILIFLLGNCILLTNSQTIFISEIDYNQSGTDTEEFIELYNPSDNEISLEGYAVVLFNGSNNLSYASYYLDGYSIGGKSFFTIGHLNEVSYTMPSSHSIQNGPDAIALYKDSKNLFPKGSPLTTTNLVDAIVYGSTSSDYPNDIFSLVTDVNHLKESASAQESIQRPQNEMGNLRENNSFVLGPPSPGYNNIIETNDYRQTLPRTKLFNTSNGITVLHHSTIKQIKIFGINGSLIQTSTPNKNTVEIPITHRKEMLLIHITDINDNCYSIKHSLL
jgi:hypothetical protein